MDYDYEKIELKQLVIENSLVVSEELITLSSGKQTHHYYDIKKAVLDPKGVHLISTIMLEEIKQLAGGQPIGSVGGLEVGAIPIATAIILKARSKNEGDINSFYIRKKAKDHGLKRSIEGNPIEPIVIVDDVITGGDSILKAIDELTNAGKMMLGVVTVVDRGGGENLKKSGIKHRSVFKDEDFADVVKDKLSALKTGAKSAEV
jgi:orotate phosphoribosyltransferase